MKVYGSIVYPQPLLPRPGTNNSPQRRAIVAAPSKAAAARAFGQITDAGNPSKAATVNMSQTGNPTEVAVASADPGVVFVKPGDVSRNVDGAQWVRAAVDPDRPWRLIAAEAV